MLSTYVQQVLADGGHDAFQTGPGGAGVFALLALLAISDSLKVIFYLICTACVTVVFLE